MVPEQNLTANLAAIRDDLAYMMRRWHELPEPAQFELRAFGEGKQPQTARFKPEWIDDAVDWAAKMNALSFNIYAVRNPVRADCTTSAKDGDILAAFFLWADCDDPDSAGNVYRFDGPKWSAAVTTGRAPSPRVHVYWELVEPCRDMAAWRQMQIDIAAHFQSDGAVINPSRIMRVGGTVTYPDSRKRGKGYISEVATIRTEYDDRQPVSFEQMRRVFPSAAAQRAAPAATGAPQIDVGPQAMDREQARIRALSGENWNIEVLRLVGSYVRRGLSDGEIHRMTDPLTLDGYTIDQTRAEVQDMIDRTRRNPKFEIDAYADPAAIAAPAVDPSFDAAPREAPAVEWFDEVEAALTDSYMVKGVLADGAMSVVYGPSNSGKTFFAMDIAFHVAAGVPEWFGRRVRQAAVLYLAAEGGRGAANRIVAMRQAHGVCDVPLALRRAGMDLLHSQADLQTVADLAAMVKAKAPGLPLLIVIDTLSRIMAGGDENSAQDMTALIRNIDAIREITGAHVMLVHHTGKDTARGARGHSSLRAATDTEIEVANEEGARAAMVTKQRDYQGGETFAFSLKSVVLGIDQDGDEVTSCTVEHEDSDEFKAARTTKKGLGGNQKIIADTFDQMLGEGLGKPNPGGVGLPEVGKFWTVCLGELRSLSMGKMAATNKRGAFAEAWKGLTEQRGLFCAASDLAWRTDRPTSGRKPQPIEMT